MLSRYIIFYVAGYKYCYIAGSCPGPVKHTAHSRDNQILLTEVVDVVLLQTAGPGREQRADILHFIDHI